MLASRFQRIVAFFVDFIFIIGLGQLLFGIVAFFFPHNNTMTMFLALFPAIMLSFCFYLFAPLYKENTLGKWIFGLKLKSLSSDKIKFSQCFLRLLPFGIWPVNLIMLMLKDRQHLGDKLAKTQVIKASPERNLLFAFPAAIVTIVISFNFGLLGIRMGTVNHDGVIAAKEAYGSNVDLFPASVHIAKTSAVVDLQVGEDFKRIELQNNGG